MRRAFFGGIAVLAACSASRSRFEAGERSSLARDWDQAVAHYEAAVQEEPENIEYRIALLRARLEASYARKEPEPETPFSGAEPVLEPLTDMLIDLSFVEETSLRTILETLAKLAGVNILFDEAYRDRTVSVELKGVTFSEALELLLETNGLFYKVIDSTAVQVTPER